MTTPDLSGKRVLLLGAQTDLGAEIAHALAEAGAAIALIAASNDSQTAFAVQRLARKLGAPVAQAIDATNEMAARVMVRQVSKELGGLDGVVFCADIGSGVQQAHDFCVVYGSKQMAKTGGGALVIITSRGLPPRRILAGVTAYDVDPAAGQAQALADVATALAASPASE